MKGDKRCVEPDLCEIFSTITEAMTDIETTIHVNNRYFPINGVTIEVPGTSSIRSI